MTQQQGHPLDRKDSPVVRKLPDHDNRKEV